MRSTEVGDDVLLTGLRATVPADDAAARYGGRLLAELGAHVEAAPGGSASLASPSPSDPLRDWASSGAMALTGRRDGPPLAAPGAVGSAARGAMLAFEWLIGSRLGIDGHRLLGERAALAGLSRRAPTSVGGACRLLAAADGWLSLSLARPGDFELIPALIEATPSSEPWSAVATWARGRSASSAAERAQLLGLAAAAVPDADHDGRDEQSRARWGADPPRAVRLGPGPPVPRRDVPARRRLDGLTVVDLSSLWAGPLCAHLLGLAGARVIKVESAARPDGARRGSRPLFDLLHGGHASVVLDLRTPAGRDRLRALVRSADVVVEASRPRALRGLGIDAERMVLEREARVWVSITAYGRAGPWANRVGYGDDVAAAAGLTARDPVTDAPLPCGDAIADPLTGLHAALGAAAAVVAGGSRIVDVAMRDVAAVAIGPARDGPGAAARCSRAGWVVDTPGGDVLVEPPRGRRPASAAAAMGADTAAVLDAIGAAA
jgi:hypothetical protein